MDFRFSGEDESFRQQLRAWLRENLPSEVQAGDLEPDEEWQFSRDFCRRLAQKRWVAPNWPPQHGGLGLSHIQQLIYSEEMTFHRAPLGIVAAGVASAGPTIITYGSEEQKRQHLAGITEAQVAWCQGFSEPNAGSDLAALQTKAVRGDDAYVINGHKIWTSHGHRADWMILLARTDPSSAKHRGISYFLLDMRTTGISVRPLVNMMDNRRFSQVFFEDVHVPMSCLLGEENRGWYMATTTLNLERAAVGRASAARRLLLELLQYVREAPDNGCTQVRSMLAQAAIEVETGRLLSYRVASLQGRGLVPNQEASVAKLYNTEMQHRLARTGLEILGLYGQLRPGSRWLRLQGTFERWYLWSTGMLIAGGTSEIQRNVIAIRGLGLRSA
jgi:alkylation response protein AidB-like acyl-CoA dehydrogenase